MFLKSFVFLLLLACSMLGFLSFGNAHVITRTYLPNIPRVWALPWLRYVVREKGKVELGTLACAMCHTRAMLDGSVVKGAQGNFPFERVAALSVTPGFPRDRLLGFERSFFGAPWIKPDPLSKTL